MVCRLCTVMRLKGLRCEDCEIGNWIALGAAKGLFGLGLGSGVGRDRA